MPLVTPNADEIVAEGFRRVAGRPATADEVKRGVTFWLEEVLAEIWQKANAEDTIRLRSLEASSVLVLDTGIRRYDWPADFYRPQGVRLLKGTITGTLVNGPGASVTASSGGTSVFASEASADVLAAVGDTAGESLELSGLWLVVTSGDARGAIREIPSITVSSSGGTTYYEIHVDQAWTDDVLPETGDTFAVCEEAGDWLDEEMREEVDARFTIPGLGVPARFNNYERQLEFDVAPDAGAVYVVWLRYWANLLKVDKDSTLMQTILTNWRVPLVRGIAKIAASDLDDSRAKQFRDDWAESLIALLNQEYEYGPRFKGFTV